HQAPATCAESQTDGEFPPASSGTRQKQARDIRTRNKQDQTNQDHENEQRFRELTAQGGEAVRGWNNINCLRKKGLLLPTFRSSCGLFSQHLAVYDGEVATGFGIRPRRPKTSYYADPMVAGLGEPTWRVHKRLSG